MFVVMDRDNTKDKTLKSKIADVSMKVSSASVDDILRF